VLAPRQIMETVFGPTVDLCDMPVTFTMREPEAWISSRRSAVPSLSSVKESISAIGLQPVLWDIVNSKSDEELAVAYLAYKFHLVSLDIFDT